MVMAVERPWASAETCCWKISITRSRSSPLVAGISPSIQFLGLSSDAISPASWIMLGRASAGLNSGSSVSFIRSTTLAARSREVIIWIWFCTDAGSLPSGASTADRSVTLFLRGSSITTAELA